MYMKKLLGSIVLCGVVLALGGCAASKKELSKAVDTYNNAVRWRDVNRALSFVASPNRTQFFKNANSFFSRMRVTDYQIDHIEELAGEKEDSCRVFVTIAYVDESTAVEKQVLAEQKWNYDSTQRQWVISTDYPFEIAKQSLTP